MKCEEIFEYVHHRGGSKDKYLDISTHMEHIAQCEECQAAFRGADALRLLRNRDTDVAPEGLFEATLAAAAGVDRRSKVRDRFWRGAGFGALAAAALFGIVIALTWQQLPDGPGSGSASFAISIQEPRHMDLAIEADEALDQATISIVLTGDVELDGYAGQRELTWTENLEAGVNRLRLPVRALGSDGGQMIVRLSHPRSNRVFVINLHTANGSSS